MSLISQPSSDRTVSVRADSTLPARGTGDLATSLAARVLGAGLALAVGGVHVVDQGGFPGGKEPRYVGVGYYLVELAAVAVAVVLLAPGGARARGRLAEGVRAGWALGVGVALGPLLGYVLSRGPGLPAYTEDKGAWTEPIGILSLLLEAALAGLALAALTRRARRSDSGSCSSPLR